MGAVTLCNDAEQEKRLPRFVPPPENWELRTMTRIGSDAGEHRREEAEAANRICWRDERIKASVVLRALRCPGDEVRLAWSHFLSRGPARTGTGCRDAMPNKNSETFCAQQNPH